MHLVWFSSEPTLVATSAPQPAGVDMDMSPLVSTRGDNIIDAE